MKAGLLGFVLDEDLAGALVVEQYLAEDKFEIVLMHVIARARHLIVTHVREIEGSTVTMTRLRDGIDITASL